MRSIESEHDYNNTQNEFLSGCGHQGRVLVVKKLAFFHGNRILANSLFVCYQPGEHVFIQKRPPQITIEKALLYLAQITASFGTEVISWSGFQIVILPALPKAIN